MQTVPAGEEPLRQKEDIYSLAELDSINGIIIGLYHRGGQEQIPVISKEPA